MMLFPGLLLVAGLVLPIHSISSKNNLRLYDSFAEVHQVYTSPLRFRQADWDNIKQESLILRSASEDNATTTTGSFERRITRINTNSTGKTVFVRKYAEQKRPILCEMVHEDQDQAIVRHIETGHYFRTQTHLIDYPDEPQMSPIYEVSFHPIDSNQTLMVTYAVNNLRWHARYILQTFASGDTRFQILADIINSGPLKYQFNSTELMSGDFNLVFGNGKSSSLIATTPSTENTVDYSGIHVFSRIDDLVTIEPNSILTLPILSPHIQTRMFFTYNLILTMPVPISNSALSITSGKHKFHRLYQLSNSSSYLPTGHLLLYDSPSHVLTGEWYLPTLTESEKYEFELGEDPDIMLIYNRTMTVNRTTNSSLVTAHVLIQNYKQRRVNIRFKSACQLLMTCLFYDDKARSLGSRLRYNLTLEAKSEVAFAFTAVRLS